MSIRSRLLNIDQRPNKAETPQPERTQVGLDGIVRRLVSRGQPITYGLRKSEATGHIAIVVQCGPIVVPAVLDDGEAACNLARAIIDHFDDVETAEWEANCRPAGVLPPGFTRDELVDNTPTDGHLDHGLSDGQIARIEAETGLVASSTY